MSRYVQDPDDVLDYAFDWTSFLPSGVTIASQTVTASTGLTVADVSESAGVVSYRVSGGTAGSDYTVTCHVVLSDGQEKDATDRFAIRDA